MVINEEEKLLVANNDEASIELPQGKYVIQIKVPSFFGKSKTCDIDYDGHSNLYFVFGYNFRTNLWLLNQFEQYKKYTIDLAIVQRDEYLSVKNYRRKGNPVLPLTSFTKWLPIGDFILSVLTASTGLYLLNTSSVANWISAGLFVAGFISLVFIFTYGRSPIYRTVSLLKQRLVAGKIGLVLIAIFFAYQIRTAELALLLILAGYIFLYLKIQSLARESRSNPT